MALYAFVLNFEGFYPVEFFNIKSDFIRKPVFANVTVETCAHFISKSIDTIPQITFIEVTNDPISLIGKTRYPNQKELLAHHQPIMSQSLSDITQNLFQKLKIYYPPLGKLALIVCGLTPYRKGKGNPPQTEEIAKNRLYDAHSQINETYRTYIMGRDFHKYRWQIQENRWISYGDWLAEPRYSAPFDDKEKIVIRQTADSIIAQIDTQQYLCIKRFIT